RLMGVKKLIGLAVPVILLFVGCSSDKVTVNKESKPLQESKVEAKSKEEVKSKEDKVKPVDVGDYSIEEYINSLTDIDAEMGNKV
ncbi:hypothetical protein ACQUY5_33215, partial [Bacillus cereus]